MRQVNDIVLSGSSNSVSVLGSQLDANQMINVSFHCVLSNNAAGGVFKIQASNDVYQVGQVPGTFTVSNWVDIPLASVTMSVGTTQGLISLQNASYRWLRAVYTASTQAAGTVQVSRLGQGI